MPGVGTSDMAVKAARDALVAAQLEPHDLDLIIVATLSPEHAFPGSGVYVQQKLGLCEGDDAKFVPPSTSATSAPASSTPCPPRSPTCAPAWPATCWSVGAETHSAALDLSTDGRTVSSLFGDGAGAVIVSATDKDRGVRGVYLGADGRFAEVLCQKIWDIRKRPFIPKNPDRSGTVAPEMLWATMDGKLVFKHAVGTMLGALMRACSQNNIGIEDIDLFLFHQANMRINQFIAQQLRRRPTTRSRTTSSATATPPPPPSPSCSPSVSARAACAPA
jgi:3-oxoacyl-[acyl-carrier-protein] synthase-3